MKKTTIIISILFFSVVSFCWAENLQLKIFKINYGDIGSFYNIANDLKSEAGTVSFDRNSNSLIVRDYPQNIERIASVIESLDIKQKQVEIEVTVAEASKDFFKNIGITHSSIIIPSGQFSAVLAAIEKNKDAHTRSTMKVRTLSNQPAELQVSTDEVIGNEVVIYPAGTVVTTPVREPIGNFLEVLPTVNDDNTIMVTLRPSVSTLEKGGNPAQRTVYTNVILNNGDTVAIGSLDTEKEVTQNNQTLFGMPLSTKEKSKNNKVVMFLTAKIID
ncbi:MAG: secretin N-terminal domain-containing protein [Candidatus Omnitrophica bacterium]|nr:secretin N-terminal domain-containing protein [Candidatus Omnitrophota bacterium]MDD5237131.1 secretin N-terminal domain-containing protein [Candidatus Omnitrophota bacterium]MDD5611324.1 secretin N-terminal domain-containing protein [Candidatus Omnitrophota bacterium]